MKNTDPTGLATWEFKPNPSWSADWYLATFPEPETDDQGRTWALQGLTEYRIFIKCRCICCSGDGQFVSCHIGGEVTRILINKDTSIVEEAYRPFVLGHEQRHCVNLKRMIRATAEELTAFEQRVGCTSDGSCEDYAKLLEELFAHDLEEKADEEFDHALNPHPVRGQGYPPYPSLEGVAPPKGTLEDPIVPIESHK